MNDHEYRSLVRLYVINDRERELWVLNDEYLYGMQRRSGTSLGQFIRNNRRMIAEYILTQLS